VRRSLLKPTTTNPIASTTSAMMIQTISMPNLFP
jgi:hypothetical protein